MSGSRRARQSASPPSVRSSPSPAAEQSPFRRYRALVLALVALAGVAVIGFVILQSGTRLAYACESQLTPPPGADAVADASGRPGFPTAMLPTRHVPAGTTITYGFCPPTSGNHYDLTIRSGVYPPSSEQAPGGWVHNLEHGSVVLLYRCPSGVPGEGDCASLSEMDRVQIWFNDAPSSATCGRQAVAARFDSMSTRFAVLAWNRALFLDEFDNSGLGLADSFAVTWTDVTAPEPDAC